MGRVSTTTGLISGINYQTVIDQLIAVQSRPKDLLTQLAKRTESEQTAVTSLSALLLSVQFQARNLGNEKLYQQRTVASSSPDLLSATADGQPAVGNYQFTPLQVAQSHQLLAGGVASATTALGGGTFTFRYGGYLDGDIGLDQLNGGAGFQRGKIRITDRSGASAEIDLRSARTVDDVIRAVNENGAINVTLVAQGDRLVLRDDTGQTTANLKVQEAGGQTATSLGLAGIDVAASQATGQDVVRLFEAQNLSQLNDGNGVRFHDALPELQVTFRDGSSPLTIDFRKLGNPGVQANGTTNAADNAAKVKITAKTAGDEFNGVTVSFTDDPLITKGHEQVTYDEDTKQLNFRIDAGASTAADAVAALTGNSVVSQKFTASLTASSNGAGLLATNNSALLSAGVDPTPAADETTLANVLATINAADPARLKAEIAPDGDRLLLTDLTSDTGGTFEVKALFGSDAARDLGILGVGSGGTITGNRLFAGLKTTLLSDLKGLAGVSGLGLLDLTDRAGATASVNLAAAETLDDVIAAINGAAVSIEARVNDTRNGLVLVDTSGQTASNLKVANGDGLTQTANKLGITFDAAATQVNSGSLQRRVVSENTRLDSLRGGLGINRGIIKVLDTKGHSGTVDLTRADIQTVGDVVHAIDLLGLDVEVRINDAGDGILLYDTGGGTGVLRVSDILGTSAAELRLTNAAKSTQIGLETKIAIDATTTHSIILGANDTLETLVSRINDLKAGVTATTLNDGSASNPVRLSLLSQASGASGALAVDSGALGLNFSETVRAQDALLMQGGIGGAGVIAASRDNKFNNLLPGVKLTVNGASQQTVTVAVGETTTSLSAGLTAFVDAYNKVRDAITSLTKYDQSTNTAGVLLGDGNILRVENDLSSLLSRRFIGVGSIQSLETLGLKLGQDGKLTFDSTVLQAKFAADPEAVRKFFDTDDQGFADKLDDMIQRLAGEDSSLLTNRITALTRKLDNIDRRIETWDTRLQRQREFMTKQFATLETTLAKMQASLSSISQIAAVPPLSA